MEEHEDRCVVCAASAHAAASGSPGVGAVGRGRRGTATAVRERATTRSVAPPVLQYRRPGMRRRVVRTTVVTSVLGIAALALVVPGVRGDGPLAPILERAGLDAPQVVDVPSDWRSMGSSAGAFTAKLPVGASDVGGPMDPANPAAGAFWGLSVDLGDGGATAVLSTDGGGIGVAGIMDDPVRLSAALDAMGADLSPQPIAGVETMRKDKPYGNGRAVDLVVVDDTAGITERTRVIVSRGRLYAIVTTGVDHSAARLDEVHARVLASFDATD